MIAERWITLGELRGDDFRREVQCSLCHGGARVSSLNVRRLSSREDLITHADAKVLEAVGWASLSSLDWYGGACTLTPEGEAELSRLLEEHSCSRTGLVTMPIVIPEGFTRDELLACVDREIRMRERVYPHRVLRGKMRREQADHEIALMRAVRATLASEVPPTQPKLFEDT